MIGKENLFKIKKTQRKEALAARAALSSEDRKIKSELICEKLKLLPELQKAKIIFTYNSIRDEVDVTLINLYLKTIGITIAYPLCKSFGIMDAAVPQNDNDAWRTGFFGIREPIREKSLIINPIDIDFIIVPCVAFDINSLKRIGWGGGYYDRFLPKCKNAYKICAAFKAQQINNIAFEPQLDASLDLIITE